MTYEEKLQDIKDHPWLHRHESLNELTQCCIIDGVVDMSLFDAHSKRASMGTNGGRKCDVRRGPCSCGAWH